MRKDLIFEFRERLVERYEAVDIVEILNLTVEDLWDSYADRIMDHSEIVEELGVNELNASRD